MITPRQPYYDWLATVASDGAQELKFESVDASRWPRIFLVPCHLDDKAVEKFIDERADGLFSLLVEDIDRPDARPADPTTTLFHQWFTVTHAENIDDLAGGKLEWDGISGLARSAVSSSPGPKKSR